MAGLPEWLKKATAAGGLAAWFFAGFGGAVGFFEAVAGERGVVGAADLELLHSVEEVEELRGVGVVVELGFFEGEEEFVDGFECGEAAFLRLLFDGVTAGCGGGEHEARELLEGGVEFEHFAGAGPCGVEDEDDKLPLCEVRGGEVVVGEVEGGRAGVEEGAEVGGVVDEGVDAVVFCEVESGDDFAVGEAEMGEASGVGFFLLEFLGVHEEDDARARGHRADAVAPAKVFRPEAAVAGFAHDFTEVTQRSRRWRRGRGGTKDFGAFEEKRYVFLKKFIKTEGGWESLCPPKTLCFLCVLCVIFTDAEDAAAACRVNTLARRGGRGARVR